MAMTIEEQRAKQAARMRRWRLRNPDRQRQLNRRSWLRHREDRLLSERTYRLNHREEIAARNRAYRLGHKDELVAYARAYRLVHKDRTAARKSEPERLRRAAAARRASNARRREIASYREQSAASRHAYYLAHREDYIRRAIAWSRANPEKRAHHSNTRRARQAGNGGSHTPADWREKVALLGGCCIYCGRDDVPIHRDHKVPLIRGGTNDIANIVPACASCNSKKGTRTASEFLALRRAA